VSVNSALASDLVLRDVAFDANVSVRGANSFNNGLLLQNINIVRSTRALAYLAAEIVVVNNSSVACRPGAFTLGVFVDDVYVGNATARADVYMSQGVSTHAVTGFLVKTANNTAQRQKLISR
jgi:hypothetical protein